MLMLRTPTNLSRAKTAFDIMTAFLSMKKSALFIFVLAIFAGFCLAPSALLAEAALVDDPDFIDSDHLPLEEDY